MKELLIIGYYNFADGYYACGRHLSPYFNVHFFPLIEMVNKIKNNDGDISDLRKVIFGEQVDGYAGMKNLPVKKNIVILWHNNDVIRHLSCGDTKVMNYIHEMKEENFKLIQVNWDPHLNKMIYGEIYCFDLCFFSDPYYLKTYKTPIAKFFQSGYSPLTSYYCKDDEYKCDVLFIGTNLYDHSLFPNKSFNRKHAIDFLYNKDNIVLHMYGPDHFKNSYPNSYKKYLKYDDCYKAFSNAKICLNISPLNDIHHDNYYYYSERMPQIIGCESVMLSNNDYGELFVPDVDYIYVNSVDMLNTKIKYYLDNPNELEKIRQNSIKKKEIFNYQNICANMAQDILKLFN